MGFALSQSQLPPPLPGQGGVRGGTGRSGHRDMAGGRGNTHLSFREAGGWDSQPDSVDWRRKRGVQRMGLDSGKQALEGRGNALNSSPASLFIFLGKEILVYFPWFMTCSSRKLENTKKYKQENENH